MKGQYSVRKKSVEIAAIYLVIGALWIVFSDALLLRFIGEVASTRSVSLYQTYKGWFFILLTAFVLMLLVRHALTAQLTAKKSLLESQWKIEHLLTASPVVLYSLDPADHCRARWASESLTRILGYLPDEYLAPHWWREHLYPADAPAATGEFRTLLDTGFLDNQYRFVTKDGRVLWIRDVARVIRDDQGNPVEIVGSWIDISAQQEGDERQRIFSTAFDSLGEGILVTDLQLRILSVNKAAQQIFGYTEAELLGKTPAILKSGMHNETFFTNMVKTMADEGCWHGEIWNRGKSGEIKPQWLSVCEVRDAWDKPDKYVAIYTDISELKKAASELQHLAHHDSLTHLPNRILLRSLLNLAINQAARGHHRLGVLFIDLDNFKSINDSLGHTVGDELLIAVSRRLRAAISETETLAHHGGDQFVLISEHPVLPDRTDQEVMSGVAERVLATMSAPFQLSGDRQVFLEACIGISLYPLHGDSAESLLRNASTAMYSAKSIGRNISSVYTETMSYRAVEQLQLETQLRTSIERHELTLVFQPKVSLHVGEICGAEALMRWHHPALGEVSPGRFIPIAERSDLIIRLGNWILWESCRQIREWLDEGIEPPTVAVNVSIRQFIAREKQLTRTIRSALEEFDVAPRYLSLEITESSLMENPESVRSMLQEMRELGIKVALDDFGSGFSNMAYLAQLPLDVLKIDISFVRNIGSNARAESLIGSVIALAKGLNLRTVAEGVETQEQLRHLVTQGCDEIQGYLFSAPVTPGEYARMLQEHKLLTLPDTRQGQLHPAHNGNQRADAPANREHG
jgi:diguanylate cyclase (GGDEF)-like protein/PAS domain S-box-containing protein